MLRRGIACRSLTSCGVAWRGVAWRGVAWRGVPSKALARRMCVNACLICNIINGRGMCVYVLLSGYI